MPEEHLDTKRVDVLAKLYLGFLFIYALLTGIASTQPLDTFYRYLMFFMLLFFTGALIFLAPRIATKRVEKDELEYLVLSTIMIVGAVIAFGATGYFLVIDNLLFLYSAFVVLLTIPILGQLWSRTQGDREKKRDILDGIEITIETLAKVYVIIWLALPAPLNFTLYAIAGTFVSCISGLTYAAVRHVFRKKTRLEVDHKRVVFESEIRLEPGEFKAIPFDANTGSEVLILAREMDEDDFDLYVFRDEDVTVDDFFTTYALEENENEFHYRETIKRKRESVSSNKQPQSPFS